MMAPLAGLVMLAFVGAASEGRAAPIPSTVELVLDGVKARTIHGWHSSRLVKYDGRLYAAATVQDDDAKNVWKDRGILLRRESNGSWKPVGELPNQPYHMLVGPDGRFWIVAPSSYDTAEVFRSRRPGDLSDMELVYNGTCAYIGASISPEGNFLLLHAERNGSGPNAVIAAFYEAATDRWYRSRFETPEWRVGYEGILLRGRRAFVIANSSAAPPPEGATAQDASPWRIVRLARSDDLTKEAWETRLWLNEPYGWTSLADMYAADDAVYLTYGHRGADSLEALRATSGGHYLARIREDFSVESMPFPVGTGAGRILRALDGRFFFVGRSGAGFSLWRMDVADGVALTDERPIEGTEVLQNYVTHTLRPQRFGGEDDGDTIHLLGTTAGSPDENREKLYHVAFRLPAE